MGSSDDKPDSDGDGINDGDEHYGLPNAQGKREGWLIELAGTAYRTNSNPARKDSDGDGLDDCQELAYASTTKANCANITVWENSAGPNLIGSGTVRANLTLAKRTDPSNPDTDKEGLSDGVEVAGIKYKLFNDDLQRIDYTLLPKSIGGKFQPATNPLDATTDADVLNDAAEILLGTDPTVDDADKVLDDDGDGLVNLQESLGWSVVTYGVSTAANVQGARSSIPIKSDPKKADADGDGLNDSAELASGTHPNKADTDGDGINDKDELTATTDPKDQDTDNDKRSDKDERDVDIVVRLASGQITVKSDPLIADQDRDTLVDGDEASFGTNPKKANTDDDAYRDDVETKDSRLNPLVKDQLVTVTPTNFYVNEVEGCEGLAYSDASGPIWGGGEFVGSFTIETPSGTRVVPLRTNESRYQRSYPFPGTPITFSLSEGGRAYRITSSPITEVDAGGINYNLGPVVTSSNSSFTYPTQTGTVEAVAGNNTLCKLTFRFDVKLQ